MKNPARRKILVESTGNDKPAVDGSLRMSLPEILRIRLFCNHMKHPYAALERHPYWNALKSALEDLVANQDLTLKTVDSHVIGYLLSKIVTATPVVVDWSACETVEVFYDQILPQCGSPSWHGRNLDALNDAWVTGGIDADGPPFSFCFLNGCQAPADLVTFRDAVEEIAENSIAMSGGQFYEAQTRVSEND